MMHAGSQVHRSLTVQLVSMSHKGVLRFLVIFEHLQSNIQDEFL